MIDRRRFIGGSAFAAAYFGMAPWKLACAGCWEGDALPTGVAKPVHASKLDLASPLRRQNQFLPKPVMDANDFRFGSDGTFTFFQLSDLHHNSREVPGREREFFVRACERYRPSLAILTGDNVNWRCRELFEGAASPLVDMFTSARLPIAIAFGNHDTEEIGEGWYTAAQQWSFYARTAGRYFVDRHDASVIGGGAQAIDVKDGDGKAKFRLCVIDSGDYGPNAGGSNFDSVRTPSVAWSRKALAGGVPSLFFQHIVVPETRDAFGRGLFRAAREGEKGVKTGYWSGPQVVNEKRAVGEIREEMCSVDHRHGRDSIYLSDGDSIYDVWRKSQNFRGAYFGHDHINSFDGVTDDGVRLGVTKTMGVSAYNDGSLSLRVFRLHRDGTYETDTVSDRKLEGTGFLGRRSPLA